MESAGERKLGPINSNDAREGLLVLVRHGESEGNRLNVFTGWRDLPLTPRGREEALAVADKLVSAGIGFEVAFTSALGRARETASIIVNRLGQPVEIRSSASLNERNYGELTGLNKTDAAERWGAEKVRLWRRSFELRPPGGESLQDTAARAVPFYRTAILPHLLCHDRVLVHGNSLRALIMFLDSLGPAAVERVELRTGEIRLYRVDSQGKAARASTLP
jgi:2,3-bisphosphoglycerate-dependent phosphoglycerate mutase